MIKQIVKLLVFLGMMDKSMCIGIKNNHVSGLLDNFDFNSPITIISNKQAKLKFVKQFSNNGKYVMFQNEDQTICGLKLQEQNQIAFKDGRTVTLVILKSTFDLTLKAMQCMINEEVYFLKERTGDIFETYVINNIKIERKVALINDDLTLVWNEDKSIIKRRSNFHGIYLKCLTGKTGSNIKLNSNYSIEAPYFHNNETYDVTNHIGGVIIDIFSIIKSELNFTTNYYMRKDNKFGTVIKYSNGTYGGIGIVSDLFHGKADILPTGLSITLSRIPYLDYLPSINFTFGKMNLNQKLNKMKSTIQHFTGSLFTPKQQKIETIDLKLLLHPFASIVWMCVLTTTGMIVIAKLLVVNEKENPIGIIWETFMTNFGGNFNEYQAGKSSYKTLVFLSLFGGNIIWMAYQASLTVDLSVSEPKLPFSDLEGLLNSDWELFTIRKT